MGLTEKQRLVWEYLKSRMELGHKLQISTRTLAEAVRVSPNVVKLALDKLIEGKRVSKRVVKFSTKKRFIHPQLTSITELEMIKKD